MKLKEKNTINISCFGAIRPLKNHLMQAMAAIAFAEKHDLKLKFHINYNRIEGQGSPILKNLENLFVDTQHELVKCAWMDHDEFLAYIDDNIDIGMQVSFSETYNIVVADHIYMDVPVIASAEVPFVKFLSICEPTDIDSIISKLDVIWYFPLFKSFNKSFLLQYNKYAEATWLDELHHI